MTFWHKGLKVIENIFVIVLSVMFAVGLVVISYVVASSSTPLAYRREKLRKHIDNPPMPEPMYDGYVEEVPQEQLNKIIAEITKKRKNAKSLLHQNR